MLASNIPAKFAEPFAKNATASYIRTIPTTSGDPTVASLDLGFPPATATPVGAGGVPPNIADFNGILNQITAWTQWLNAGGAFPPYDSTFQTTVGGYPQGAVVASATTLGIFWLSTADNNATNPDTGGAGWTSFVPAPVVQRDYLAGLTTSNDSGTPNTKIDIAAGMAADSGNAFLMNNSGALVINCATTGANGLDAGSLANNTWYHTFLIAKTDGTVAGLASTSVSGPTMPATYVYKRRIGSFLTDGSAHILAFSQLGDQFLWKTMIVNLTNFGMTATVASLVTLSVPTGVQVSALMRGELSSGGSTGRLLLTSPDESDQAATQGLETNIIPGSTSNGLCAPATRTNTSGQVRIRTETSSCSIWLATFGWIDARGKDA